jgi:hypothetical protein
VQVRRAFGHLGSSVNDREVLSLHHGKDAFACVDERAIEDQVPTGRELCLVRGRTLQPMVEDPSERRHAVPAVNSQLPQRIALDDPALEPDPLTPVLVEPVLPDKATSADPTTPALLLLLRFSIPLHL